MTTATDGQLATASPPDPMTLLRLMIEKGTSPDQLGKMMDLQERWEAGRAKAAFGAALAAFQQECPPIQKLRAVRNKPSNGASEGTIRYKWAAYEDIMPICGPILARHKIGVQFSTPTTKERFDMTLRVRVGSHTEDYPFSAPMPDLGKIAGAMYLTEPQAFGLVMSYFKRYHFCSTFNVVVVGEDNDVATAVAQSVTPASDEDVARIRKGLGMADWQEKDFLAWLNLERLEDMTKADFEKGKTTLNERITARKAADAAPTTKGGKK